VLTCIYPSSLRDLRRHWHQVFLEGYSLSYSSTQPVFYRRALAVLGPYLVGVIGDTRSRFKEQILDSKLEYKNAQELNPHFSTLPNWLLRQRICSYADSLHTRFLETLWDLHQNLAYFPKQV
jgi:hypothetical protein